MGILVKNTELENGIITDLYYRMPYYKANDKSRPPQIIFASAAFLHFTQTKGKSGFETAGDNQDNPIHRRQSLM